MWYLNYKLVEPTFEYTGWELPPECLFSVQKLLVEKKINKLNVVEFGSGKSTEVILQFKKQNNLSGVVDSFDADSTFSHPSAKIRNIISYNGTEVIDFGPNDYSFYDILDGDLRSSEYNLVLLDGHHGHGRSVAWRYLKKKLEIGCLVVIDDYDHFPFIQDFLNEFPNSILRIKHWENNKRWVVYEVV